MIFYVDGRCGIFRTSQTVIIPVSHHLPPLSPILINFVTYTLQSTFQKDAREFDVKNRFFFKWSEFRICRANV